MSKQLALLFPRSSLTTDIPDFRDRDIQNLGILCSVDLFPVPDKILDSNIPVPTSPAASHIPDFGCYTASQASSSSASSPSVRNVQPHTSRVSSAPTSLPFGPISSGALKLNYVASDNAGENAYTYFPLHPFTTPSAEGGAVPLRISPFQIPRRQPMLSQLNEAEPPSDIVLRIGNHLVTESSKLTPALVGERFVEPTLIDYKGKKCLVFVFGVCLFFECCFGRTDRRLTGSFHVFLCYISFVNPFRGMLNWLGIRTWQFNGRARLFSGTELLTFFRPSLAVKSSLFWRNCMEVRSESILLESFLA